MSKLLQFLSAMHLTTGVQIQRFPFLFDAGLRTEYSVEGGVVLDTYLQFIEFNTRRRLGHEFSLAILFVGGFDPDRRLPCLACPPCLSTPYVCHVIAETSRDDEE
jgi:hypothetical protein